MPPLRDWFCPDPKCGVVLEDVASDRSPTCAECGTSLQPVCNGGTKSRPFRYCDLPDSTSTYWDGQVEALTSSATCDDQPVAFHSAHPKAGQPVDGAAFKTKSEDRRDRGRWKRRAKLGAQSRLSHPEGEMSSDSTDPRPDQVESTAEGAADPLPAAGAKQRVARNHRASCSPQETA